MVSSSSPTVSSLSCAKDAPQTHSDPFVDRIEAGFPRVLKIPEPPSKSAVQGRHDFAQTLARVAFGLRADGCLQLFQAFPSWEAIVLRELIAEKFEGVLPHIHNLHHQLPGPKQIIINSSFDSANSVV